MQKLWLWILGIIAGLIVLLITLDVLIDEPLRVYMEQTLNERLQGYTTNIDRLDFHAFGFSLDLEETTLSQDAHPAPPVAYIPWLTASVEWRALLSARGVADFVIAQPQVHITRLQLNTEAQDDVPVQDRGWQEAVQITDSMLGFVNTQAKPNYRVFLANAQGRLTNRSNQLSKDPIQAHLEGKFMGSGDPD